MCEGLAAVRRAQWCSRRRRSEAVAAWSRAPRQRHAPGDVCRTTALLLRRRQKTGTDLVPERLGVRWVVADRAGVGQARPLDGYRRLLLHLWGVHACACGAVHL